MTAAGEIAKRPSISEIGESLRERVFRPRPRGLGGLHHFDLRPGFEPVARAHELGRLLEACLVAPDDGIPVHLFSDGELHAGYASDGDVTLVIAQSDPPGNPPGDLILLNPDAKKARWEIALPPRFINPWRLFEAPLTAHDRLEKATHPKDGFVNASMLAIHELLDQTLFAAPKDRAMILGDRIAHVVALSDRPRAALGDLIPLEIAFLDALLARVSPDDAISLRQARDLFAVALEHATAEGADR